jgi:hypothetical protein
MTANDTNKVGKPKAGDEFSSNGQWVKIAFISQGMVFRHEHDKCPFPVDYLVPSPDDAADRWIIR